MRFNRPRSGRPDGTDADERYGYDGEDESRLVSQRSLWFSTRAGASTDSTSAIRFMQAVTLAIKMPDDPRDTLTAGPLLEAFSDKFNRDEPNVLLLGATGIETDVSVNTSLFGAFGKAQIVENVARPYGMLAAHFNQQEALEYDLNTAAYLRWRQDTEETAIIEASKFFAHEGLLIGRITEPGFYQPIALPLHPLTSPLLKLLASFWSQLRFSSEIAERQEAAERLKADVQALLAQSGSPDGSDINSFVDPLIERLSDTGGGGFAAIEEPPILKLWRLMRLREDSWESLGPFPGEHVKSVGRITQLDTHPRKGGTVIAAAAGGGAWRTDDSGQHWRPLIESGPTLTMGAIAFAPSNPDILYAASGEDAGYWNPSWPGAGVYRSDDGGKNWELTSKVSSTRFSAIMVHPHDARTVYVAGNKGLHKSDDGGRLWIINPGLLSLFDGRATDIVLDYDDPDRIYIGVHNLGILRSLTGGESQGGVPAFTLLNSTLPTGCDAGWVKLAIGRNGDHGSRFIVAKLGENGMRIFVTTDGGDSWEERTSVGGVDIDEWTSVIAVDPSNESRLYAGSNWHKLFLSVDGGKQWLDSPTGVFPDQQDLAFDHEDDNRIYLANDGGVFLSPDKGANWVAASGGLAISQIYDLDISEQDSEVVACGAQDTGFYHLDKLGRWIQDGPSDVTQVSIDPSNSDIVYNTGPFHESMIELFYSDDGGKKFSSRGIIDLQERSPWVPVLKLHPDPKISDPANDREMFFCGSRTLYHSSDAGKRFQRVDYNRGGPLLTDGDITALEYGTSDPSILYLGTSNGVLYKAGCGGLVAEDWMRLKQDFLQSPIAAIAIDWRSPDNVWVVLAGNGVTRLRRPEQDDLSCERIHVARTSDGGLTWINASGSIADMRLPDVPMSAIAVDPFDRNVAYVGTDVGVFRTSDGGASWLAFQDGLPRSPVTELRLNRRRRILFAATMGRGVYRRSLE
jgi:photosystem II stability/assembly factor-like uncharacterized protein